ncbi:hypothetical protein PENTCL1PPCAC_22726 [Pristionchus entomophagus]|uniref:Innexin n=1 Tax=Pristionchus entomophagus TaxID=358040 RepID=A0AAV5U275_9BILA|nr:hypothetical protein PENTCL1PPCAC_22726 [Pristionchus entomophagus]
MNVVQGLLSAVKPLPDGDSADRLSYCLSTVGLILGSAFVSGWSFVGSPIQCWFPAYYKGWWMEYALDYCYVQNTYFIPFSDEKVSNAFDFGAHMVEIPKNITDRESKEISYYQWVPFMLAFQAFLFYAPIMFWRAVYESTGYKVKAICETCAVSLNMEPADRKKNMTIVSKFLTQEHDISSALGGRFRNMGGGGTSIIFAYLVTKLLFSFNAIFQFFLLQKFLNVDSPIWGFQVISDLFAGREWAQTANFPRVTLCDFSVRVLGNLHRHTVQCVLMINMFNEKIFVGLWFWLCIMVAVSVGSFMYWLVTSSTSSYGRGVVSHYIHKMDPSMERSQQKKALLDEFITTKLHSDGVFLIRLISSNSGDTITAALLKELWDNYVKERGNQPPPYTEPLLLGKKTIDEDEL